VTAVADKALVQSACEIKCKSFHGAQDRRVWSGHTGNRIERIKVRGFEVAAGAEIGVLGGSAHLGGRRAVKPKTMLGVQSSGE
jgi:hypothetical protein